MVRQLTTRHRKLTATSNMATYKQIQALVRRKQGWMPKTCWIAHCKELKGLALGHAHNRDGARQEPCPDSKRDAIYEAFHHFGML